MRERTRRFICGTGLALLAIALFLAPSSLIAQEKATGEGVKVHGHWTIDVRNADGTPASHHEFENALQLNGQTVLAFLLARKATAVGWQVSVSDGSPANLAFLIQDQAAASYIPFSGTSTNLTVTTSGSQAVLAGSIAAPFNLQIAKVETDLLTLSNPTATQADVTIFTGHTLPQPIGVQANQIVQVTVVFSFS